MFNARLLWLLLLIVLYNLALADANADEHNKSALPPGLLRLDIIKLPLVQSRWLLRSIQGKELHPGTIITLEFPEKFMGTGSAQDESLFVGAFKNNRHYDGVYTLRRNNRFTMEGCCQNQSGNGAPNNTPEQEYLVMLNSIYRYKIAGEILTFYDEPGKEILQFRKLPDSKSKPTDLFGKTWRLVSASKLRGIDLSKFTLRFAENKPTAISDLAEYWHTINLQTLDGKTSCQDYTGSYYYAVENMLAVASINRTLRYADALSGQGLIGLDNDKRDKLTSKLQSNFDSPCGKRAVLTKDRYFDLLKQVWRYEVSGTRLRLYSGQADILIFEQAHDPY